MTQEDKDLLLKDLSGRLSYGVKIYLEDFPNATLKGIVNGKIILHCDKYDCTYNATWDINYTKPFLFPLSSMTEEQKAIYGNLCYTVIRSFSLAWNVQSELNELVEWLNKNHFDYRNLITRGLAIDCTNLNIY